jgi:glycosyltransferase involved in cell wall biosynthesis
MISCITITQEGRLDVLAQATADFRAQSVRDKELVIVHDGTAGFHDAVSRLAPEAVARVVRAPSGRSLGALRNLAIESARGEYICQWDDDDRYHPRRLEVQREALLAAKSDASALSDQLHLFADAREMYWDDWYESSYPLNFVPGTLLARRDAIARYPDELRGEDTGMVVAMARRGCSFARVREQGYLYVYVFHGGNSFGRDHHAAISLHHRFGGARLLRLEASLRRHIAEYQPSLGNFTMPCDGGRLEFG